jgi:OOP family OmpA-OmpF porin
MSQHHKLHLLALAAVAALIAAPAQAQSTGSDSYYYLGVGGGQSRANNDDSRVNQNLLGAGVTPLDIQHHGRHSAYKVFGGYQFNRYWGAELGFFKLGRYGFDATTSPAGTLSGEYRVQGMNADLVGTLPLTENLSALGRVGVTYARTRAEFNGTGAVVVANPSLSDREANAKVGLGLQYAIGQSLLLRGEVENYRVSNAQGQHNQVAMYSVSLVMPFGRAPTSTRSAAVAPAYVAPMPAPAPQPVIVVVPAAAPAVVVAAAPPAPPERRRVSYSAASLFGFDHSALRPEG